MEGEEKRTGTTEGDEEEEDNEAHNAALRRLRLFNSYTENDIRLSEMKMDREMRLRKISSERDFRSRHLNAMANRKLETEKQALERASVYENNSMSKEKKSLQKELSSLRREKSISVDEHLAKVRARSANARLQRHDKKTSNRGNHLPGLRSNGSPATMSIEKKGIAKERTAVNTKTPAESTETTAATTAVAVRMGGDWERPQYCQRLVCS